MKQIKYFGLKGRRNSMDGRDLYKVELLFHNKIVSKVRTPTLDSDFFSNLWWRDDMSEIGISFKEESVSWSPSQIVGYVIEISYPARFSGSCGFGVISEELPDRTRLDNFICARLEYSNYSLEFLLSLTAKLSTLSPKPVRMVAAFMD
jgi:hypothetical protein